MKPLFEFNKEYNFYKVTAPDSCYLTFFKDGDDIKSFYSTREMYTPSNKTDIRCITEDENNNYLKQKEDDRI